MRSGYRSDVACPGCGESIHVSAVCVAPHRYELKTECGGVGEGICVEYELGADDLQYECNRAHEFAMGFDVA